MGDQKADRDGGTARRWLSRIHCLVITRTEEEFENMMHLEEFQNLRKNMPNIMRLPNPCYPETMTNDNGHEVVKDCALLDIFKNRMKAMSELKPGTVGAIQSHRNAWHIGNQKAPGEWLMVLEKDVRPRENSTEKLLSVLRFLANKHNATQMVMLSGTDKRAHHDMIWAKSTGLAKDKWIEIRTYPGIYTHKGDITAANVGYGLKWYLISSQARNKLLDMQVSFQSFERAAWKMIFDNFDYNTKGRMHSNFMRSVLLVMPSMGGCAENTDDPHGGSGRRAMDDKHTGGRYIFIDTGFHWDMWMRLSTLATILPVAMELRLGIVMVWPIAPKSPMTLEKLLSYKPQLKQKGVWIKTIADTMNSEYTHYKMHGNISHIVEKPLMFVPSMRWLDDELAQHDDVVHRTRLDAHISDWISINGQWTTNLKDDMPTGSWVPWNEWPSDAAVLVLPTAEDLAAWNMFGCTCKGKDELQRNQNMTQSIQAFCAQLQDEIGRWFRDDPQAWLIIVKIAPIENGIIESFHDSLWEKYGSDKLWVPKFLNARIPNQSAKWDGRRHDENYARWGESLAKAAGLLALAPFNKIFYIVMTWTMQWAHAQWLVDPDRIMCAHSYEPREHGRARRRIGPAYQPPEIVESLKLDEVELSASIMKPNYRFDIANMRRWAEDATDMMVRNATDPFLLAERYLSHEAITVLRQLQQDTLGELNFLIEKRAGSKFSDGIPQDCEKIWSSILHMMPLVNKANREYENRRNDDDWNAMTAILAVPLSIYRWREKSKFPLHIDSNAYVKQVASFDGNWSRMFESMGDIAIDDEPRNSSRCTSTRSPSPRRSRTRSPCPKRRATSNCGSVKLESAHSSTR